MLEILCFYTKRFELLEIEDHLKRIFDLVLSSNVIETFGSIFESGDDVKMASLKLEALRCFGLLTIGCRLFNNSDISINYD